MPGKRILILYNRVPHPLNDGGNIAVHAMIQGYKRQGWEVYLLAMHTTRHRLDKEILGGIYKDIYAFETVDVDNDVTTIGTVKNFLFSSEPNHAVRFQHKQFADKISSVITSFKPDVVHIESVFLSSYLPAVKKQTNAKLVLRLHNIEWQVWQRLANETKGFVKKYYLSNLAKRIRQYEQKVWPLYDVLIPITPVDADVVKQFVPDLKIITIPVGVDIKPANNVEQHWVGYHLAAMDWLPNCEAIRWFIQDVWPAVHSKEPGFQFHFAGRNMPAEFKAGLPAGITCDGEVPDGNAYVVDKKILIVPLRSGGGIRVKILEAMAMGKVVISTTVGIQGIDAIQGKHFLLADTPEQFASAVSFILNNKVASEQIAQNARHFIAEHYDSASLAQNLTQKLNTILRVE
ncbi:MAG: glycosyltransferase [Bacteroidetes bacterium]|nr:glycosyltransferase [Bacteroidota bacterium]